MAIIFDIYGNLIRDKINKKSKLTDKQKEIIREIRIKYKTTIDNETRTFFCIVHNRFHKHLYHNKPSETYLKCLKSGNIVKFKDDYTNSELFRMDFKNNWNQDKADYYKST